MGTMYTVMLFTILLGLVLDTNALTKRELEKKINMLEDELEKRNIKSEKLNETLNMLEDGLTEFEQHLNNIEKNVDNSKTKITRLEQQLEYGGKKYETVQYTSTYSNYS